MKPHRRFSSLVLAGMCLLLTSCIDSKDPLSSPEKAKTDAELAGIWRTDSQEGCIDYYFLATAGDKLPPGVMRIVTVAYDKKGALARPGEMLAFSTELGKNRYLNIAFIEDKDLDQFQAAGWKPELVKGYLIVKYQVQGDTLIVWEMDPQAKRHVIADEKLKGTIDKNAVFFTDTPEKLAALLADPNDGDLFTKTPTQYQRVK